MPKVKQKSKKGDVNADFISDKQFFNDHPDVKCIIGVDEVNRGGWVGNVFACAFAQFKGDGLVVGVKDSKKIKRETMFTLAAQLKAKNHFVIQSKSPEEIDANNILNCTMEAMAEAVKQLICELKAENKIVDETKDVYILIDGNRAPTDDVFLKVPTHCLVKGDAKSYSIGAAAIVAKVKQIKMMQDYHLLYPSYNFKNNNGYGADPEHLKGIIKYGVTPVHRKCYFVKALNCSLGKYKVNETIVPKETLKKLGLTAAAT